MSPSHAFDLQGAAHVFSSVVKKEGVFALWKGFFPYYSRIGPHTVLTFIILEQMNELYAKQMSKH
jgi:solute carrier family 25 oxoglutarate transporter 11